jgi:hypothetical protein|tara:strand:- start:195 stop:386 length:192 start_codon:yes stop_codon:yes gene_type:complete
MLVAVVVVLLTEELHTQEVVELVEVVMLQLQLEVTEQTIKGLAVVVAVTVVLITVVPLEALES